LNDLHGSTLTSFRKLADFVGNNCETFSVFTGAGRFYGCVDGKQVGLVGYFADDFNLLSDISDRLECGLL
jgi:hypothetical protein